MLRSNQLSYITETLNYTEDHSMHLGVMSDVLSDVLKGGFAFVDKGIHAFFLVGGGKKSMK